jgi:hypothetical protein
MYLIYDEKVKIGIIIYTFLFSAITPSMKEMQPNSETRRAICLMVAAMRTLREREESNGRKKNN